MHTSAADEQDRAHVAPLLEKVQHVTGGNVELAYADQGYTGEDAARAADTEGIELVVVKRSPDQKGFMVLSKRWVVERSFGWMARCRRLLRDFERLGEVLTGLHMVAFVGVMLRQASQLLEGSS